MSVVVQLQTPSEAYADSALLRSAVEACPESLAVIEDGRVVFSNRAFAHLFGYLHPSELQGRRLDELFPGCRLSAEAADHSDAAGYGNPAREWSGTRQDGTQISILNLCASFHVNERDLWIISTREVSPEGDTGRRTPTEAQKMEALGRLAGGVAHDFNNLLTGIMLYCDLLIAALEGNHSLRRHVEEIRSAGKHGSGLIRQLLAVAGQRAVAASLLSWNDIVADLRNLLTKLIGENIQLATTLADDLGWVKMDPAQAQQIVLNLVLNARDAMPEGGRVTLETRNCRPDLESSSQQKPRPTAGVEFTVTDTGCGMDAEAYTHLFEPFFTSKRPGRGTGLGLATVFSAVQQAGGIIEVKSEPGAGTRVSVYLPRIERELAQKSKPSIQR